MPGQVEQSVDLSALIIQLADKIGESISAKLQSDKCTHSLTSDTNFAAQTPNMTQSNVSFLMHSDVKEPPIFRGDSSYKFSVHEWVHESIDSLFEETYCSTTRTITGDCG